MSKNKAIYLTLIILSIFTIFTLNVSAEAIVSISKNISALPSDNVTVPIYVINVTNLGSGNLNVTYNASVVHVINVTNGTENALALQNWNVNNSTGIVRIVTWNASGPMNGTVIFANVTYKAVGIEGRSSSLNISVSDLTDYYNYTQIPYTLSNGTFIVLDVTPPVITSAKAEPDEIIAGQTTLFNVTAIDNSSISSVTINLTAISGSATQALSYNSTADAWQYSNTVTKQGNFSLPVNVTDAAGNSNTSVNITLNVSSGAPAEVILSADRSSVPADGTNTTNLTAIVKDAYGNLINNTRVNFTTTPIGIFNKSYDNITVYTDVNGKVLVNLSSTDAGTATVTADASGVTKTIQITFLGPSATITISANPSSINAGLNTTNTTITVTLKDRTNKPADNVPVNFSTDLGTFENLANNISKNTDSSGIATVRLNSTKAGTSTVTATALNTSGTVQVVIDPSSPASVIVTSSPSSITADGISTSTITAKVNDTFNNPVEDGTEVIFQTTAGSINPTSTTTTNGIATSILTSSTTTGIANVSATSDSAIGYTEVNFIAGEQASISLSADKTIVTADGNSTANITAIVRDAYGNTVGSGKTVNFTTTLGKLNTTSATTDANGAVVVKLNSTKTGIASVSATSGTATNYIDINFVAGSAASIIVTSDPSSIIADGVSTSTITATVRDAKGNNVADGTVVTFNITKGSGTISPTSITTTNGIANATLTSSTILGNVTVNATADSITNSTNVTFIAGSAASITLTADKVSVPEVENTTNITATVKDAYGHVLNNTLVNFITTLGTLNKTSVYTDASGNAVVNLTYFYAGTAIVTATSGSASGSISITFEGALAFITVVANPPTITAGLNLTNTSITATLRYSNRSIAKGERVQFNTTLGVFNNSYDNISIDTGADGTATVKLNSTRAGTATITVSALNTSGTVQVVIEPSSPASVIVSGSPSSIIADGISTSTITARINDTFNNPVKDGTDVLFLTTDGSLTPVLTTTTDGIATATLTSSTTAKTATITAISNSISNTTSVIFTAGSPTSMSLQANPSSITADGTSTSTITATVSDIYGNRVSGATVNFTTTSGSISSSSNTTEANGIATSTLTSSTTSGTATITARSGSAVNSINVEFKPSGPASVSVSANPDSITADGTSTSTITATVKDGNGNIVADGTIVTFNSTGGTISPSSATTVSGIATTALTSSTTVGEVTVKAMADSIINSTNVTFSAGSVASITLTADKYSIPSDGVSTVNITVRVLDGYGNHVSGKTVIFSKTAGTLSKASNTTDANGTTKVTLTSSTSPGIATVTASVSGITSSINIAFEGASASLTVLLNPTTVIADGVSTSTITVVLLNKTLGYAVNETVSFSASLGELSSANATTDSEGRANITITSTKTGTSTITASALNTSGTANVVFIPGAPTNISVSANPSSITADGTSTSIITATIKDAKGNIVEDGTDVIFSTTSGLISPSSTTTTNGIATTTLTSSTTATTAIINASSGGASGSTNVTFTAGSPASLSLQATLTRIIADGTSNTTITAVVTDTNGNPVNGTTVEFTTTLGSITSSSKTGANGIATATLTSSTTSGTATVKATSGSATNSVSVEFIPGDPSSIILYASPSTIPADGISTSTIIAIVKDVNGNKVADGTIVTFNSSGGTISPTSTTTTNGIATTTLTSSTTAGSVTVNATSGTITKSTTVTFKVGSPSSITLSATNYSIPSGGGVNKTNITAIVKDGYGNKISNANVVFSTTSGTLDKTSVTTNADGIANVTLTSSTTPGIATVKATSGSATSSINIVFEGASATITVLPNPTTVIADGTSKSTITVVLLNKTLGYAEGETVSFSASIGTLDRTSAITDSNGRALVNITSTKTGTSTITASALNTSGSANVEFIPDVPADISVSSNPSSIPADGTSTSIITATIKDAYGNKVADGTDVTFSTTSGLIIPSYTTTTDGIATATLTSSTTATTANVTAISGSVSNSTDVTFTAGSPSSLSISADNASITADGSSTSIITVVVTDTNGNPVNDTTVDFTTTRGTITPSSKTGTNGIATATLTSSTTTGTATITAISGTATNSINVLFVPSVPASVSVSASPTTITADGTSTSLITAIVKDAYGNKVSDGTVVSFNSSGGTISPSSTTTSSGIATTTLTSTTTAGSVKVNATSNRKTGSTTVTFKAGLPASIALSASNYTIDTNPIGSTENSTDIFAIITDSYGNRISNAIVGFSTTSGTLDKASATTKESGIAKVTLTASDKAGIATVTATSGGIASTLDITFRGDAATLTVLVDPSSVTANGVSKSTITVILLNRTKGKAIGEVVSFSASLGKLSSASATTDNEGRANVTITSNKTGISTITASALNTSGTANVVFIPDVPSSISVSASPYSITADGTSTSSITAIVKDAKGNKVADGTHVSFSTTNGTLSPLFTITTNGVATTTLTSSTSIGTATITATAGSASGSTSVTFIAGSPASMTLHASPTSITADSSSTSSITGIVKDINGNPVNGTTVDFTTTLGSITPSSKTGENGIATATLTSSNTTGTATVRVIAGGISSNIMVTFTPSSASKIVLSTSATTIVADGTSTLTVTAIVKDENDNKVADGTLVSFTTTSGEIVPSSAPTTSGIATATLTSSTVASDDVNITASVNGISKSVHVKFIAGPASSVSVFADPSTIEVGGKTSLISAIVKDAYGNGVADGTSVSFSTQLGSIVPTNTTVNGVAYSVLTSKESIGITTVTASVGGIKGTTSVNFVSNRTPSKIFISADPTSILVGGSTSNISIFVQDPFGNPLSTGSATFTTTLGSIDPSATISNGNASVNLTSGNESGTARVTVWASNTTNYVEVVFVPDEPKSIVLSSSPSSITADGISTSTISAVVYDKYGNRVSDGKRINFTTTSGFIQPYALTTLGVASATLTSSTTKGTATVKAETLNDAINQSTSVTFTAGKPASLSLEIIDSSSITANGTSYTLIKATVKDSFNNLVEDGTKVTFTTNIGTLNKSTLTTQNGVVLVKLTSSKTIGTATIRAETDSVVETKTVEFKAGEASKILLTASPSSITADGKSSTTISAEVLDENDNKVADGTRINFTTTLGGITYYSNTSNGIATAILNSSTTAGTATVNAFVNTSKGEVNKSIEVVFKPGTASSIMFINLPPSIPLSSSAKINVSVKDAYGNNVSDGTVVTFSTTAGHISATNNTINGVTSTTLTSTSTNETALVTAAVGSISNSTKIDFGIGTPYTLSIVPSLTKIVANESSSIIITATLKKGSQAISNELIKFSATSGTINASNYTDTNGIATAILISSKTVGTVTITATSLNASNSTTVEFIPGDPRYIEVSASKKSITADGSSTSTITAIVKDEVNNTVADGTLVTFNTTNGSLSPTQATTLNGKAIVTLTSSTKVGTANVTANNSSIMNYVLVDFIPGSPSDITLSLSKSSVKADGVSNVTVTAKVVDRYGNSVKDGTTVTFSTTSGKIEASNTTINGNTSVNLTASNVAGSSTITASVAGISADTSVEFTASQIELSVISPSTGEVLADGKHLARIMAQLKDGAGNNVRQSEIVINITTTNGTFSRFIEKKIIQVETNANGRAFVKLRSTTYGTANLTANSSSSAGEITSNNVSVDFIWLMSLSASPRVIDADGVTNSTITAHLYDAAGTNGSGINVTFRTTLGSLGSIIHYNTTNESGYAVVNLTSLTPGLALVTAINGSTRDRTLVGFRYTPNVSKTYPSPRYWYRSNEGRNWNSGKYNGKNSEFGSFNITINSTDADSIDNGSIVSVDIGNNATLELTLENVTKTDRGNGNTTIVAQNIIKTIMNNTEITADLSDKSKIGLVIVDFDIEFIKDAIPINATLDLVVYGSIESATGSANETVKSKLGINMTKEFSLATTMSNLEVDRSVDLLINASLSNVTADKINKVPIKIKVNRTWFDQIAKGDINRIKVFRINTTTYEVEEVSSVSLSSLDSSRATLSTSPSSLGLFALGIKPERLKLKLTASSVSRHEADSTALITAQIQDSEGNDIAQSGVVITFETNTANTRLNNGTTEGISVRATTDASGAASVNLTTLWAANVTASFTADSGAVVTTSTTFIGDVNNDGKITAADALMYLRLSARQKNVPNEYLIADVTGTGMVTATDALTVLTWALGE